MRDTLVGLILISAWTAAAGADLAPALEWVTTTGGSGNNVVAAAAANHRGNLYIVGSTTSVDFPATGGAQRAAGGSLLTRINLSSGSASVVFPANLPSITFAAAAPSDPSMLYAASGSQVWKSSDSGSTWTIAAGFGAMVNVQGLAVDPTTATTIYAAISSLGVEKSIDGGQTWTTVNGGADFRAVWVQPTAPNVIFASGSSGLARSTDGGGTWTVVAPGIPSSALTFDPLAEGTLYLGSGSEVLKSTDNGASFVHISSIPNQAGLLVLGADPHHAGVLYAGTTAGLYVSSDMGVTWSLKFAGVTTSLGIDPNSDAVYINSGNGIVKSTDRFASTPAIGPNAPSLIQFLVAGENLLAISMPSTEAFAVKLDGNGNVVYSTYFGGSGNDAAVALAVGADGSLYVTGTTTSADLPVTAGAYLAKLPLNSGQPASFVFKLKPDGSLGWATYFTESGVASIAVDGTGNAFVGGYTGGGLPTTPGAYQTVFQQTVSSNGFFGVVGPTSAFVTKFNAAGSGLLYSTYVPNDNNKNTVQEARALAVDAAGDAWIGVSVNSGITPSAGTSPSVVELNSTGSALLASAVQAGFGGVTALTLDASSNVYIAGSYAPQGAGFPAIAGAFQTTTGGGMDAFVAKWDSSLTQLLAATLLGGEQTDTATSVAVDDAGNVIVGGYTDSKGFPTRAPFQTSFSPRSGFVAEFDASLSNLLFSTYLGDGRPFATEGAFPDGNGNILLAGSTMGAPGAFVVGANNLVIANKITLTPAPPTRLDSVQNYASHMAQPLAPGEPILAVGSGFANGAQIVVDGTPLATVFVTATSLAAVLPETAATSGVHTVQVSNGAMSNSVYAPASAAAPAIYTVDRSGTGQGYILNSDGTLNSPSNPAATGSAITIFGVGEGKYSLVNGYAVAAQTPAVFIDGFYCNGIAARVGPVPGLPGNVYQLSVFVPDPAVLVQNNPDLKNFVFPAQSKIQMMIGPGMLSQDGVFISIK